MADQTSNSNGDARDVVQSGHITGIVNLGGTNTVENVAIGDNATITNNGSDKDKK